jgi:hypothetical protein
LVQEIPRKRSREFLSSILKQALEAGCLASPLDHACNAHAAEWFATLIDEDIGRRIGLLAAQQLEAS